jgi:hypothetical protein
MVRINLIQYYQNFIRYTYVLPYVIGILNIILPGTIGGVNNILFK